MSVIESTTFTLTPGKAPAALAGTPTASLKGRRGSVGTKPLRIADTTWLDIVERSDGDPTPQAATDRRSLRSSPPSTGR